MKIKSFKKFLDDKNWKNNSLSFDSSFGEHENRTRTNKNDKSWKKNALSFDSSFGEHKNRSSTSKNNKKLKESEESDHKNVILNDFEPFDSDYHHHSEHKAYTENGESYHPSIHDHPHVKPQELEPEHERALRNYTSTGSKDENDGHSSSANINGYLRNRSGDKKSGILGHRESDVHKAVLTLSSAFTENNTNRKSIKTWGAVPAHIGQQLMKSKPGSQHHFAGFTSTSTDQNIARGFSSAYLSKERKDNPDAPKERHVVRYHLQPGTGISAVHHSQFSENEVVLHHGAKLTYHGSEKFEGKDGSDDDVTTHVHHVTVHPEHKKLEEYGEYDHPSNLDKNAHPTF